MNVTHECLLSQPVFYQVLNVLNDISIKNYSEKVLLLLQVNSFIQITVNFRTGKILRTFLSPTKHSF